MEDQRCVRFASIGHVEREELQLIVDVWLEDALKAPWATKDTMKLAGVLAHYIATPSRDILNLKAMEDTYQLNADSARRALVLFSLYGLIDAYSTDNNELRAALRLSQSQLVRVLKTKRELNALLGNDADPVIAETHDRWEPPMAATATVPADASVFEPVVVPASEAEPEAVAGTEPERDPAAQPLSHAHVQSEAQHRSPSEQPADRHAPDAPPVAQEEQLAERRAAVLRRITPVGDTGAALSGHDALARSLERLQKRVTAGQ